MGQSAAHLDIILTYYKALGVDLYVLIIVLMSPAHRVHAFSKLSAQCRHVMAEGFFRLLGPRSGMSQTSLSSSVIASGHAHPPCAFTCCSDSSDDRSADISCKKATTVPDFLPVADPGSDWREFRCAITLIQQSVHAGWLARRSVPKLEHSNTAAVRTCQQVMTPVL